MTDTLQRVLRASEPLTLAGVPTGFLPLLAADLARAAHGSSKSGRAVVIASDETAMRALAETVPLFAPEVEVLTLPGVGLPALRPHLARAARDGGAARDVECAAGARRKTPQLLIATENAATQRMLTPFRIRQLTQPHRGRRADRSRPAHRAAERARLRARRIRSPSMANMRSAARSSTCFRRASRIALRLDFFGDEIESLRRFDPADQRSTDRAKAFTLMPASEALLDEESDQALPLPLSRDVRRYRDRRSALRGDFRRPPDERDGALAALVRGAADDPVRPSRRE